MKYDKTVPLLVGKRLEEFEEDEATGDRPFPRADRLSDVVVNADPTRYIQHSRSSG